jgi:Ca2+-dependent lipid-binding protein
LNPQDISNKIQLFISCRNLADLDLFTKSDPQCVVYIKDSKNLHYTEIGKTEMINNNLNPDFTTSFTINYFFEREQILKFEVYDIDFNGGQELIGVWETSISKIVTSNKQTQVGDLKL